MSRKAPALAALLLAAALAGCLGGPAALDPADGPLTIWERGLSGTAATPPFAPVRSDAERRADVAPPGAPQFAAFDAVMERFMAAQQIPAASVAVMRGGQLRYEQGYGFLDEARTKPTPPDAMFRIASLTKPMTAAVIGMLVEQGLLAYRDPVFCLPPEPAPGCRLPIEPHARRPVADPRLADVQVGHLVAHRSGWTRGPCDPFWDGQPIDIAAEFGIPSPPPRWRMAQWFMGTPMQYDPGTNPGPAFDTYCNAAYMLLGLIAEAATGASIAALYEAYLFQPLEVEGHIEPGRTLVEHRNPREPFYFCEGGMERNVYRPEQEVCSPDGGFDLESIVALGGLIATPAAVAAVFEVFWNNGTVRGDSPPHSTGHTGGLPGTATTAWRVNDGPIGVVGDVQIAVFFNKVGGHELQPANVFLTPYAYQLLYVQLAAAYAGAEARVPV